MCFNVPGADGAVSRWRAGSGLGVSFYYLTYGPSSQYKPASWDAYCWGWMQGYWAVQHAIGYYSLASGYYIDDPVGQMMVMDIDSESGEGWSIGNAGNNWETFSGFTDYVAGRSSQDSACPGYNNTWTFQYMLYTSPQFWQDLVNTSIANTPIWTTQPACYSSTQPADMNPAVYYTTSAGDDWNSYSNWLENWQFDYCSGPDWDLGFNEWWQPLFGQYMS